MTTPKLDGQRVFGAAQSNLTVISVDVLEVGLMTAPRLPCLFSIIISTRLAVLTLFLEGMIELDIEVK